MVTSRYNSLTGQLARLGFTNIERAEKLLSGSAYDGLRESPEILDAFSQSADPDQGLLSFERVLASAADAGIRDELVADLLEDDDFRLQLALVLGASEALAEHLVRHPDHYRTLVDHDLMDRPPSAEELKDEFIASVNCSAIDGAPWLDGATALRVAYRRRLLALAARDLSGHSSFSEVTHELAHLADAVLAACLELRDVNCRKVPLPVGSRSSRWASVVGKNSTTSPMSM